MSCGEATLQSISAPKAYYSTIFDTIYRVMDNLEFTVLAVEDCMCSYAGTTRCTWS